MGKKYYVKSLSIVLAIILLLTTFAACASGTVYNQVNGSGKITILSGSTARLSNVYLTSTTLGACYSVGGTFNYKRSDTTIKFWSKFFLNGEVFTAKISTDGKKITACGKTYKKA